MRVVFAFARMMPAYGLAQISKGGHTGYGIGYALTNQQQETFQAGSSAKRRSRTPVEQSDLTLGDDVQLYEFTPVQTPLGKLSLSTRYLRNCDFDVSTLHSHVRHRVDMHRHFEY